MNNDEYKIENLIKEYGSDVLKTAYLYTKDMSVAEDIFQDVFIKIYKKLHTFKGKSSIKTWIIRITINTSKDFLKSAWNKKSVYLEDNQLNSIADKDNYKSIYDLDRDKHVKNVVLSLPKNYKDVVICIYFNEMSLKETAKLLKLPIGTVKSRLSRAKDRLRYLLEGSDSIEIL